MQVNGQFTGRAATSLVETIAEVFAKRADMDGQFVLEVKLQFSQGPLSFTAAKELVDNLTHITKALPADSLANLNLGIQFLNPLEEQATEELQSTFSKKMELLEAATTKPKLVVPA